MTRKRPLLESLSKAQLLQISTEFDLDLSPVLGLIFLRYFLQGFIIITIEVIIHAGLCVFIIGWEAGFQYYVLIHPVVVFLTHYTTLVRTVFASIYCFSYVAIHFFIIPHSPYMDLNPTYISLLLYYNFFSITILLSTFAYTFNRIVVTTEEKLEKERERANAALIDRSKALTQLNDELSEAASYVRRVLPQTIEKGSIRTNWRFVPSTSLGGDAFGYHMVDKDHFAIYLIVYSDGVYEVEKRDGSMWQFQEFTEFIQKAKANHQPVLDRLYGYVKELGDSETLEDDFTILEVAFT